MNTMIKTVISLLLLVFGASAFVPGSPRFGVRSCLSSAVAEAPTETEAEATTVDKIRNIAVIAHVGK